MLRFVALAIPLLLLLLGLAASVQELTGLASDETDLQQLGLARAGGADDPWLLGEWLLEATGITALFLVVAGRGGTWWLDGLIAGGLAWIFRGPALLLTLARVTHLPPEPWVSLARGWLVTYLIGGLSLALLFRHLQRPRP